MKLIIAGLLLIVLAMLHLYFFNENTVGLILVGFVMGGGLALIEAGFYGD